MNRIAFLGLGAMGARMAARLADAGLLARVWNRSPGRAAALEARGIAIAPTPLAAAAGADIVITMLRDDDAARAVWLDPDTGALAGMTAGSVAIDCSTVTAAWARDLHRACGGAGIACLDAPVAGSLPQAEAGQLIFMAGGEPDTIARVEPVLKAMGAAIHPAGPAGAGASVKLLVNALLGIQIAALAEIIGFARGTGLDPARVIEIIGATPVASPAARVNAAGMLSGRFAPLFPVELLEKDFGYAEAAAADPARVPMIAAARAVFRDALSRGMGADNMTGVVRLYDR